MCCMHVYTTYVLTYTYAYVYMEASVLDYVLAKKRKDVVYQTECFKTLRFRTENYP